MLNSEIKKVNATDLKVGDKVILIEDYGEHIGKDIYFGIVTKKGETNLHDHLYVEVTKFYLEWNNKVLKATTRYYQHQNKKLHRLNFTKKEKKIVKKKKKRRGKK